MQVRQPESTESTSLRIFLDELFEGSLGECAFSVLGYREESIARSDAKSS